MTGEHCGTSYGCSRHRIPYVMMGVKSEISICVNVGESTHAPQMLVCVHQVTWCQVWEVTNFCSMLSDSKVSRKRWSVFEVTRRHAPQHNSFTGRNISYFLPSSIPVHLLYIKMCYMFRPYLKATSVFAIHKNLALDKGETCSTS